MLYVPISHREPGKNANGVVFDFYGIFICIRIFVGIAVEVVMTCVEYARGVQSSPGIAPGNDAEILVSVLIRE